MSLFVIDCCTWVRALGWKGHPNRALQVIDRDHEIAISQPIYQEILDVLSRPRLVRQMKEARVRTLLDAFLADACWVSPTKRVTECEDPKDDIYLECALEAGAQRILSNDKHLLNMSPWRGVRIVTPEVFLMIGQHA